MLALLLLGCFSRLETRELVRLGPVEPVLLFHDVSVFPATGPELLRHQDVLVREGRIASVEPTGPPAPEGAVVIAGAGRTLLPGLVDAHVHVGGEPGPPWAAVVPDPEFHLQAWLYSGVTTVFDLGGEAAELEALAAKADSGALPGPRIRHTGRPITAPGGHPIPFTKVLAPWPVDALIVAGVPTAADPDEGRAAIARQLALPGVAFAKIVCDRVPDDGPRLDDATLQAMVETAHAAGKRAFVHVGSAEDALSAVRAGADVLAHTTYRSRLSPAEVAEIAASGVPVIHTLVAFDGFHRVANGIFEPTPLEREILPAGFLAEVAGQAGSRLGAWPGLPELIAGLEAHHPDLAANVAALHAAGSPVIVGSDSVLPAIWPGSALHTELRLLVEAGVPSADVLLGATARAAALLGETEYGTIEAGKSADLLLVEGDPLQDITATTRIVEVIRAGRRVERLTPG